MSKKNKLLKPLSKCCYSPIKIGGIGENQGLIIVCEKCGKVCELLFPYRKTWLINPQTKIIVDKRNKIKNKIIDKELKIGNA